MTKLLEEAFLQIQQLTAAEQDEIAALILEELKDEQLWDAKFSSTQDQLKKMAEMAKTEIKAGKVQPGGFGGN